MIPGEMLAKAAKAAYTIAQLKFRQLLSTAVPAANLSPVPLDEIKQFLGALDAVVAQDQLSIIQVCSQWILKHITPSQNRVLGLGQCLVALSKTAINNPDDAPADRKRTKRMRFNVLSLIHDVLYADWYRRQNSATESEVGKTLMPYVNELVELAAACISKESPQLENRLMAFLNFWCLNGIINAEDSALLRATAMDASRVAQGGKPIPKRTYLLPEFHGLKWARWQRAPTSHILDQTTKFPHDPVLRLYITDAKFDKKPGGKDARKLVDSFHDDLELHYRPASINRDGGTKQHKLSLDNLGQLVKQDKLTRSTFIASSRFGWSTKVCRDMSTLGLPANIEIAQEKYERLREDEDHRRRQSATANSESYEDQRPTSSRSNSSMRSNSYDFERRGSRSSRDSYRSYSRSPSRRDDRYQDYRDRNATNRPGASDDRGQRHSERGRSFGRDSARQEKWRGPTGRADTTRSNTQNFSHGGPQMTQPPYNAPMGQFPSNVTPYPQQFQGHSTFGHPANANGPYAPHPGLMQAMPNNPYQSGNQYGNQQQGNNFSHGQNRGGYAGGRGDYGGGRGGYGGGRGAYGGGRGDYGGHRRGGGYNNNRGQYGGSYRGQPGNRY